MKKILLLICLLIVTSGKAQHLTSELVELIAGGSWYKYSKTFYVYNPDGTIARENVFGYDNAGNMAASPGEKKNYTYDMNGKLSEILTWGWNAQTQSFGDVSKISYTYDSDGLLVLKDDESFDGSFFPHRTEYINDPVSGLNTMTYMKIWIAADGIWENLNRSEKTYDNDGRLVEKTSYSWGYNNTWVLSLSESWTYNAFGKIDTYVNQYDPTTGMYRETSYYDASQLLVNREREWQEGSDWKESAYYTFINNTDGTLHQTLEQGWNFNLNAYQDTGRYTYTYGTAVLGVQAQEITSFDVYPNPASDVVHLVFENETEAIVRVSDLQGKLLKKEKTAGATHTLSIEDLPGGVYLLSTEVKGKTEVRRIVKS